MKIQVPLVRSPRNLKLLRPNLEKVGYSSKCSFGDGDSEKEERKEVRWKYCITQMEVGIHRQTSEHLRCIVRQKNKLKYWVIHSQMSEKERKQSSKVTTLRFSEMWDIVQFRRQQTDNISDRPYGRVRESFSLFGISLKPKDLLQLCTSFTFSQNWPWITANVTLDCENDALYSVSTPRLKSIIAYFSFLISPDFLNSVVPFASNANLYQQWMPRLHVHQFV